MSDHLLSLIATEGPLTFEKFMEIALYHEPGGYYTRCGVTRTGRQGDFFTSISVGRAYGVLLAHRIIDLWHRYRTPPEFLVIEPGPESGQLAGDLLQEIARADPDCYQALSYHVIEPVAAKHSDLIRQFSLSGAENVSIHCNPDEIHGSFGTVIANEILDALPVHLLKLRDGCWHERLVASQKNALTWKAVPCQNDVLLDILSPFTIRLPNEYQTEVCLGYRPLLSSLASCFEQGTLLLIDYGFSSDDLYHPNRTTGTLRVYRQHQAFEDPLQLPGLCDLTAHVNFSQVLTEAQALGLHALGFCNQESYLTTLATPLFTASNSPFSQDPSFIRQFRTLTHPSMLGGSFQVLELTKGSLKTELALPSSAGSERGLAYLRTGLE